MLRATRDVGAQGKSWPPAHRERKARFSRDSPSVDIIFRERAELIDQLPVVVPARLVKGSPGLVIEQPGADTVPDLAPTSLLIDRARVIYSQVIDVGLPNAIDKGQRNRAICSPERLLRAGPIVERVDEIEADVSQQFEEWRPTSSGFSFRHCQIDEIFRLNRITIKNILTSYITPPRIPYNLLFDFSRLVHLGGDFA